MSLSIRWLIVAPVVLFVFGSMVASCSNSSGCGGSFDAFGDFIPNVCPGPTPAPGFELSAINICAGTPVPTPVPTTTSVKTATPTPTACPIASPVAIPTVGGFAYFNAQGVFVKKNATEYADITNSLTTNWGASVPGVVASPPPGEGGTYQAIAPGCVCVNATSSGISSLPVLIAVAPQTLNSCPVCPTPTPTATPTATALPARATSRPTPAVSQQSVSQQATAVYSVDTGSPAAGPIVPGPNGTAYVITRDAVLHAIDSSGAVVFDRPAGGSAAAVAPNGTVFAQGTTTWFYALDPSGKPIWQKDLHVSGTPLAATNTTAYVAAGGNLISISSPGQIDWTVPTDPATSGVTIADGVVIASDGGDLTALSTTGSQIWSFSPAGGFSGALAVGDGVVYAGSRSGTMYAIDASNGSEVWSVTVGGPVTAGPSIGASGMIYFAADGLYAIDSSGNTVWSDNHVAALSDGLALSATGSEFVASPDGSITMLDALGTGEWITRSIPNVIHVAASPSGLVFVASGNGHIYALR